MKIAAFQKLIEDTYIEKDRARGIAATFMWFTEEVGELSSALLSQDRKNLQEEFADVFAWMSTLASLSGVQLEDAIEKYKDGCPSCKSIPCACTEKIVDELSPGKHK